MNTTAEYFSSTIKSTIKKEILYAWDPPILVLNFLTKDRFKD